VNRRKAVTPDKPKPGGSWFQVQPEVAHKDDRGQHFAVPSPTMPSTLRANRCRRHHPLEQRPQVIRRHPLDKRSSHHPDCRKITPSEMASYEVPQTRGLVILPPRQPYGYAGDRP
jgi:hypothetical protein